MKCNDFCIILYDMTYCDTFRWNSIRVLSATADWGSRPDPWECEALQDVGAGLFGPVYSTTQTEMKSSSFPHFCWWHSKFFWGMSSCRRCSHPLLALLLNISPQALDLVALMVLGKTHIQWFQLSWLYHDLNIHCEHKFHLISVDSREYQNLIDFRPQIFGSSSSPYPLVI